MVVAGTELFNLKNPQKLEDGGTNRLIIIIIIIIITIKINNKRRY